MAEKAAEERQSEHWTEGEDESNDDTSNPSVNSEELRARIALSNAELEQLSKNNGKCGGYAEEFFEKVRLTNNQGVECIGAGKSKEALAYLSEAQRYLEYGACCGMVIDRNLIVCVLHNEGVAYQRIWAIDKCSKYVEGAIYNIETSLKQDTEAYSAVTFTEPSLSPAQLEMVCSVMRRKQSLAQYYLQYCALMSQLKNHSLALTSSFKAMALMKDLFATYYKFYKSYAPEERSNLIAYGKKLKLFKELSSYKQELELPAYPNMLKRVRWVLKEWRNNKNSSDEQDEVLAWIKSYSIGNAMQMEPYPYLEAEAHFNFKREFDLENVFRKVLLFAISYFTVATEIRLSEVDKFQNNEQERRRSEDFQRSELYHLTSIKIFATFIPYESMFVKHVLHSYSNHYKPDLTVEDSFVADDQLEDAVPAKPASIPSNRLSVQQPHQPERVSERVVQHTPPVNIPEPPQFKPIEVHHHHERHKAYVADQRQPEQQTPQQPMPFVEVKFATSHPTPPTMQQQPPSIVDGLSHYQSASHFNNIQATQSAPIKHNQQRQRYEAEEDVERIRSHNSQVVKLKKKNIRPLDLNKIERAGLDQHRKNSNQPVSTKSNTKNSQRFLSPRVGKPAKHPEARGEYYCNERSATKKRKNPERQQKEKVHGDRTSRSARPKLATEIDTPRQALRGKSREREPNRKASKSLKAGKRKEQLQTEFQMLTEEGYYVRKPPKQKTTKPKNTTSKKRL